MLSKKLTYLTVLSREVHCKTDQSCIVDITSSPAFVILGTILIVYIFLYSDWLLWLSL